MREDNAELCVSVYRVKESNVAAGQQLWKIFHDDFCLHAQFGDLLDLDL